MMFDAQSRVITGNAASVLMIFDDRIRESLDMSLSVCRDRGWSGVDAGALCLSLVQMRAVWFIKSRRIVWQRGTGTRLPHPLRSTPCPYRTPGYVWYPMNYKRCYSTNTTRLKWARMQTRELRMKRTIFTEEHTLFRDALRHFVEKEIDRKSTR